MVIVVQGFWYLGSSWEIKETIYEEKERYKFS